jgi:protein CpxP
MKKILFSALALVAVLAGAAGLTAFRHHRDPAAFVDARVAKLLDEVNATDAQRTQINAIKDKLVADLKTVRASHQGLHDEFLAQWQADRPDQAKVHALIADRATAMKGFADEVADALLQVHDILTPEQRATLAQKVKEHHQQRGQGQGQ